MRVILAHKFFRITGGAEVFFFETARVLKENGHEVAFFSTNHPDNLPTQWDTFFIDPPAYDSPSLLKKTASIRHVIFSKKAKSSFARLISVFNPDIVHAFGIYTHLTPSIFEAAHEANVPVLMSCNDYKHICPNYKIYDGRQLCEDCRGGQFYKSILKKCCKDSLLVSLASALEAYVHENKKIYDRLINRYLFASQFMLQTTKKFWENKKIQYGILKNPFDSFQYQPVYYGKYALYFGRIIGEKGLDCILNAAKKKTIPIKIIGDGPDLAKLKSEIAKYNLNHVELLGPMWGNELKKILYGARFVIVPSLWHENFPYVIFQAFAAGKPVIGSYRGGIPELIGVQRGLLFEPDNQDELATQLNVLWTDTDRCRHMGQSARQYVVSQFSDEKFYKSLMINYEAILL